MLPYDLDEAPQTRAIPVTKLAQINVDLGARTPIPPLFYGLNVQPGTVRTEFTHELALRTLKPDTIRIMTNFRADWFKGDSRRHLHQLSSRKGEYNWKELDLLVAKITDVGAVPHLSLGFGPPVWLQSDTSRKRSPPPRERLGEYADFMEAIVSRYSPKIGKNLRVSIENEPENVGYQFDDYLELYSLAHKKIKRNHPQIMTGGPAIGYAAWPQKNGKKLSFSHTMSLLKRADIPLDFIDWHIYSHNSQSVIRTVDVVRRTHPSTRMVISELNRDWRYSGISGAETSKKANTSWESVSWLASTLDQLQQKGVDQVFYFGWREQHLGLIDRDGNRRPAYYLYWALTNIMGKEKVACRTAHPQVGCIATTKSDGNYVLLYNSAPLPIQADINLGVAAEEIVNFSEGWHKKHHSGEKLPYVNFKNSRSNTIPAGGFLINRYPLTRQNQ